MPLKQHNNNNNNVIFSVSVDPHYTTAYNISTLFAIQVIYRLLDICYSLQYCTQVKAKRTSTKLM